MVQKLQRNSDPDWLRGLAIRDDIYIRELENLVEVHARATNAAVKTSLVVACVNVLTVTVAALRQRNKLTKRA
jgi:hypothetical protein